MNTLIWFQRDLRLTDNAAFSWALQQRKPVIAVYVHSPDEDAPWAAGAASRWWLHHSLKNLQNSLRRNNIELLFFHGDSEILIPRLTDFFNATTVTWTCRHEPFRRHYEASIAHDLEQKGITIKSFRDELLGQPDKFLTVSNNTPYRVFTPFYKRLRRELDLAPPGPAKPPVPDQSGRPLPVHDDALNLDKLNLLDTKDWHKKLHQYWTPGEHGALANLQDFVANTLENYPSQRDYPALRGTSILSPHLHFGEISPAQLLDVLAPIIEFGNASLSTAAETFLRQLIWREFARYILYHFPETVSEPMNRKFTSTFWRTDPHNLKNWQQGKTGIAIIDAGMKQLWETGTMHNRVRMLVASLLTKNMGLSWQHGARWFWETLVDADLANNTMGWQWVAGCGVDAAPYFRIFNPETQARRFDPEHRYIKRWLKHDENNFTETLPINLASSRQIALDRYNQMIRGQR